MFFVLVVMPFGASLVKAAAELKKNLRCHKAWLKEARELEGAHGDLRRRRLHTINVMLTKKEMEDFEETPAGEFLADRSISEEATAFLQGSA